MKVWALAHTLVTDVRDAFYEMLKRYPRHKDLLATIKQTLETALQTQAQEPPFQYSKDSAAKPNSITLDPNAKYKYWSEPFVALASWAYEKNPDKLRTTLKILPLGYSGTLQTALLPGGKERLCTNYGTPDKKRLIKNLAIVFPEIKGFPINVGGEFWVIP